MGRDPWFYFFPSDWLGSTRIARMDAHEERGLLRILCHMWASSDCSLPDDDAVLARLSLIGTRRWANGSGARVRECLEPHPDLAGQVTNPKLLALKRERVEWRQKSQAGGRKAAQSRKFGKGGTNGGCTTVSTTAATNGQPPAQPNGNLPSPSPSPIDPACAGSSTSNGHASDKQRGATVGIADVTFPAGMDRPDVRSAVDEWLAYKRDRRQPYKRASHVDRLLIQFADRYGAEAPGEFIEAVGRSIANNWAGVLPPRPPAQATGKRIGPGQKFDQRTATGEVQPPW